MKKSSVISGCGQYRYSLGRVWDDSLPKVGFIMLNPSTADADQDDPTIRRCIAFAKSWGYGGIVVTNLLPFRATNPRDLLKAETPQGEDNSFWITECFKECEKVIYAWGNSPIIRKITKTVPLGGMIRRDLQPKGFCIQRSKDGTPKHPLYLKGDLIPIRYETK